jgi:hypothetical protein
MPAELDFKTLVLQSYLCHPDWTVQIHAGYVREELAPAALASWEPTGGIEWWIDTWLKEFRAARTRVNPDAAETSPFTTAAETDAVIAALLERTLTDQGVLTRQPKTAGA